MLAPLVTLQCETSAAYHAHAAHRAPGERPLFFDTPVHNEGHDRPQRPDREHPAPAGDAECRQPGGGQRAFAVSSGGP
ncbi:hypothetical protein [Paraburkholderia humisilvae]|uniref:hypothetical protein n=1 Tax=Paraburkholderia humisilvae TaxID=627669 RepID=UPI001582C481|nr:hypothetical protein [Paraburkholderia humisilvae]